MAGNKQKKEAFVTGNKLYNKKGPNKQII